MPCDEAVAWGTRVSCCHIFSSGSSTSSLLSFPFSSFSFISSLISIFDSFTHVIDTSSSMYPTLLLSVGLTFSLGVAFLVKLFMSTSCVGVSFVPKSVCNLFLPGWTSLQKDWYSSILYRSSIYCLAWVWQWTRPGLRRCPQFEKSVVQPPEIWFSLATGTMTMMTFDASPFFGLLKIIYFVFFCVDVCRACRFC